MMIGRVSSSNNSSMNNIMSTTTTTVCVDYVVHAQRFAVAKVGSVCKYTRHHVAIY